MGGRLVELPATLPARLYLLTYDPEKARMGGAQFVGPALRAAALLELLHRGLIADEGGRVVLVGGSAGTRGAGVGASRAPAGQPAADAVVERVLAQIAESRTRSWQRWVARDNRRTTRCARDDLAAGRWIRVDRRRVLGVIPRTTVTVRDQRAVRALLDQARRALRGQTPVDQLDPGLRELTALAVLGELRPVATGRERRAYRTRTTALAEQLGPLGPALRKVIRDQKSAHAAG
jgi:hypothetical protein